MDFTNCKLYRAQSKKYLKFILNITDNNLLRQKYVASKIKPWIDTRNGGKRLIESPNEELKRIQKRIKKQLNKIVVSDNVFSGIKKKSYVNNACFHSEGSFLYKIDMTAFFPFNI